ncbi:hypothetical protein CWM47_21405 [Spirosoma pollinicola]|uniref:Lipoprotein n=1 Tax=Spirosoma pollinicola TaxID=2057025 RepID=A0A2K8Z2Q4_9BACT|nr:hypothetical protein CWM47_21405 [Spirosoma pollinicola]
MLSRKTLLLSMLLWAALTGCKKNELDPVTSSQPGEVAAVITKIDLSSLGDCTCCTPYQIQIDKDTFQADQLPGSFETLTTTVWLKYEYLQLSGTCNQVQNRIGITSIRNR